MNKSLKKNYIYNLGYQIITILIPIITAPYISRVLGVENIGIYSYTVSIVTYFILFGTLGTSIYGQREVAYLQSDKENRSKVFWEIFLLRSITIAFSTITYILIFCIDGQYADIQRILLLNIIANGLDISWFFQGIEEFKKITIRNTVIRVISFICILIFVKDVQDLKIYVLIYSSTEIFGAACLWIKAKKYIDFLMIKKIKIFKHIKPILTLFIPQIAIQIYTVLDKTMLGIILQDMSQVGYYEQSQKIIKLLMTIVTSVTTIMMPRIANYYAEGKENEIKEYMYKTLNFILLIGCPMVFGLISVSKSFIPIFFGEGYSEAIPILKTMSCIILFIGFSSVIGNQYLITTKRQKEYTISVIMGSIINFILNVILIKKYLSIGAAIATVIAEFSVMAIQLYYVRKELNIKKIIKTSFNYFYASVIMMLFCIYIENIIEGYKKTLIIQVVVGVIIYTAILYLLNDKMLDYILSIVEKKLKIKKIKINKYISKIILIILTILSITLISVQKIMTYNEWNKSSNYGWRKYSMKPILGDENTGTLFDPYVIKDNEGKYRMYVSSRKNHSISLSISDDGINWSTPEIVFEHNSENKWDEIVNRGDVIYVNNKYYMYYTGQHEEKSMIGVAVSSDGYHFNRVSESPVIIPEEEYEKNNVMNANVIYDNGMFKMYYAAGEFIEPDVICLAISTDGINFKKYEKNPILMPSNDKETLDYYKVGATDVHKISNNKYLMFYIGYTDLRTARILTATSNDGINWNKNNKTAIISPAKGTFDSSSTYKPSVIYNNEKNKWMLWYNGRNMKNEYIGLATNIDLNY